MVNAKPSLFIGFSRKVGIISRVPSGGLTMQMRAPSVQSETDGLEGVVEVNDDAPSSIALLFDGPAPALWAGFGAFILIFVIGLMLIIRGRVAGAKPRARSDAQSRTFFEPAGEDADITFDGDPKPEPVEQWSDDRDSETEILIEHNESEPVVTKSKKSAFSGLFSKKPSPQEQDEADNNADYMGDMVDEGFFPEEHEPSEPEVQKEEEFEPTPEPESHPVMNAMALAENENRLAQIEETAKAALKRAEDAETLARDLRRANQDAEQVMTLGLRKTEAEMSDRADALIAMEKRLAALSDEFQSRINIAQLEAQEEAPHAEAPSSAAVSEDHFEEFANLMGEQFDALRSAVNTAVDRLSKRIEQMPSTGSAAQIPAFSGAVTSARVQLSDLLRDALPPQRYVLSHQLNSGRTADACITMPSVVAPIAIDARFPVEAFDAWQEARGRTNQGEKETELRRIVLRHIADAAEKLIEKGETADCAMMFIPSEHILSELHAHFSDLVQEGNRARIWMVAPTSLMATLHTISAVMGNTARAPIAATRDNKKITETLDAINNRIAALEAHQSETPAPVAPPTTPTTKRAVEYTHIYDNKLGVDPKPAEPRKQEPESKPPFPLR